MNFETSEIASKEMWNFKLERASILNTLLFTKKKKTPIKFVKQMMWNSYPDNMILQWKKRNAKEYRFLYRSFGLHCIFVSMFYV